MRVFLAAVVASGQQHYFIHFSRELDGKPVVLYFLMEQISRLHLHFSYCQLKDEVIVWMNGFLGDFDQHTENMPCTITLKADSSWSFSWSECVTYYRLQVYCMMRYRF